MNDTRLAPQAAALVEEAQDYYKALLRPIFAGRKFLHAGAVAVGLGNQARMLGALGAARPFLIADGEGTGQMPTAAEAELRLLNIDAENIVDQHRQSEAALQNLSAGVQAAVDAWDPEHDARCICSIMLHEVATVAGRRKYALREPAWAAFEDKIAIDAFWDAIGVRRAPSRIVAAQPRAWLRRLQALTGASARCGRPTRARVSTAVRRGCAGYDPATTDTRLPRRSGI